LESVIRPLIVYIILYALFRLAGKRTLASITAFDFVLLLIVAESVQNALIGNDMSMTNALLIVTTLIAVDIGLSLVNARFSFFRKVFDDVPLILIDDGKVLHERLAKSRVEEGEIMHAARQSHGLERMEQIKYAILEPSGGISIVPRTESR
jgi:uncharacterized membrane protein YcaP (DUF421 family)